MMKNKILLILSFTLCGMNSSYGSEWSALHKVAAIGGIGVMFAAGNYASKLNEEYHSNKKRPDWQMRLCKTIGAGTILLATDMLGNNTGDTKFNLGKLAAFTISLLGITDTAGYCVRQIPILKGILADPVDDNNNEIKDSGAVARVLLLYIPLRAVISKWLGVNARF